MDKIIGALQWRYATKKFINTKKLSKSQVEELLEAVRLAPASYGLQSYRIILVEDEEKRKMLREVAYGQSQFTDASNILVFAVRKDLNENDVKEYMEEIAKVRGLPMEQLKGYSDMINNSISTRDNETKKNWATRQAYIALGVLLTVAATEKIDATPMEGFDIAKFDEILGLGELGLTSVVVAAVGFRDEGDDYLKMKKVRMPKDKLFIKI